MKYKLIQDKYIQERFVCMKQVSMFTEIIMKYLEMANIWKFVSMKTTSDQETRDLGIEVGDFVSFDPRTEITSSGFIKSRHLDDKASVAMILELLENLNKKKRNCHIRLSFIFLITKK